MKPERRISSSVLLGGIVVLLLALVTLWFGLRTPVKRDNERVVRAESILAPVVTTALVAKPVGRNIFNCST